MDFELTGEILTILMNLAGLMLCLFRYFEHARKSLIYAIAFFIGNLLSNYYWGVYMLVMYDYPNVSSMFAYFGWNLAYVALVMMELSLRKEQGIRSFYPISLLPVPVNIAQLILYLQYGGIFNNLWQVFWTTLAACLSLDTIIYYFRNKDKGKVFPWISAVVFFKIAVEYIAWTASCFDWPSEALNPYNYMNILSALCLIFIPLAFTRIYGKDRKVLSSAPHERLMNLFRPLYSTVVVVCCLGGYILAIWMRNTLDSGIGEQGDGDPYKIIAVMLFVVSVMLISFTMIIMLVVGSMQKTYEGEELRKAKSSAEKSSAIKSEFLANMSHEIRTPINAVLGMNEMILRESLEARDDLPGNRDTIRKVFSDICNYSGNIESAGKNLLSIINDILDFSKIEAGKLEIVDASYKLSSVLNDVSNMIIFKARDKGLEFDVEVDRNLPEILCGDGVRVHQVITNLLNNAVKYTEEGRVVLSVSEKRGQGEDDRDQTSLVVAVKDTGIGIKDEDKNRLFRKFERFDIERNSSIEGTGLGLAITGSLIKLMGGTISVESEYGKGSVFTAVIPQRIISDEPIGDFRERFEKSMEAMKKKREPFHADDAVILVVDDTPMNLMVVKGLLKNILKNIETANNGAEAVNLARHNHYDIIFIDQRMPGMDGTTTLSHIKRDKGGINAATPFICLTADAISGARERYIAEGFDDYLSKPIASAELEKILETYLPKDKIIYFNDKTPDKSGSVKEEGEEIFDPRLIDRGAGLGYCENDEEFYDQILSEYYNESGEKSADIERCYKERNWDEYGVYVHSLKSTSMMIGATELSKIAGRMEKAAKDGDAAAIDNEHEKMSSMYKEVAEMVGRYIRS
ncbi:MAG: response regulator [Lachnospiraceae bacterium]|nr:response regulator [Lachnospiraceae bacterium]